MAKRIFYLFHFKTRLKGNKHFECEGYIQEVSFKKTPCFNNVMFLSIGKCNGLSNSPGKLLKEQNDKRGEFASRAQMTRKLAPRLHLCIFLLPCII